MRNTDRPICFVDFDRTLFDTEALYRILRGMGDPHESIAEKVQKIEDGIVPTPNMQELFFKDIHQFLKRMTLSHNLVLLTYSTTPRFQKMKIDAVDIAGFFSDIRITDQPKWTVMNEYIGNNNKKLHMFIDDQEDNIRETLMHIPHMHCFLIDQIGNRVGVEKKISNETSYIRELEEIFPLLVK